MSRVNKVSVTVPESHTDLIIKSMAEAGAGVVGKYTHCAHISKIIGNYMPEEGSSPYAGTVGEMAKEAEDKVEMICPIEKLELVISTILKNHPYESPTIDVYEIDFYTK